MHTAILRNVNTVVHICKVSCCFFSFLQQNKKSVVEVIQFVSLCEPFALFACKYERHDYFLTI